MITIPYPFLMKYSLNEIFPLKRLKFGMAPIDFYFTKQYNKNGYDICVPHDKFPVKLFPIKQIQWQGLKVNIPQDDIRLLNDNYHTWHIPDKGKGPNKKRPTC